jgi:glutamate-ammonia-ligase adenylyltransferase
MALAVSPGRWRLRGGDGRRAPGPPRAGLPHRRPGDERRATAETAGQAFADLADLCLEALAPASLAEAERLGGAFPGEVAVVALGKCGSREMSAGSDLDLMTLYRASEPAAMSSVKAWARTTFYGRFTQRLIAALSSQTAEGGSTKST